MTNATAQQTIAGRPTLAAAPMSFDPVTRETLSAQIRDQLLERITNGSLEPGRGCPRNGRCPSSSKWRGRRFGRPCRACCRSAWSNGEAIGHTSSSDFLMSASTRWTTARSSSANCSRPAVSSSYRSSNWRPSAQRRCQRAEIRDLADRFRNDMTLQEFRNSIAPSTPLIAQACGNPLLVEVYHKVLARLFRSDGIESLLSDAAEPRRSPSDRHRLYGAARRTRDGCRRG